MSRFDSLGYSLSDTRRVLRQRFARYLPTAADGISLSRENFTLRDESVLALLLDLKIEFESDVQHARQTYESLRLSHPEAPQFEELFPAGWVRLIWGRVRTALHTRSAMHRASEDTRAALAPLFDQKSDRKFDIGVAASQDPTLESTIATMRTAPLDIHHLACPSSAWVIARIWERAPEQQTSTARLRFWIDRCDLLPYACFAPSSVWTRRTAEEFRAASFEVLGAEGGLLDWESFRQRQVARAALESNRPATELETLFGAVPTSLVARYLWMTPHGWEHVRDDFDTCGQLWYLATFLLYDVEEVDLSPVPHPVALRLFDLAIERPELLDFITRFQRSPVLLADMVLDPRFSALVCMLVARWVDTGGAWDRGLTSRDNRAARQAAFADAVAVTSHFASEGTLEPGELAALLSWMHSQAEARPFMNQDPPVDEQMFAVVRSEFARLSPEILSAVAKCCISSALLPGLGTPEFAAALDAISLGMLADTIEPKKLVSAYIESVRAGEISLSAARVTPVGARSLVQMAARATPDLWRAFLEPLDMTAAFAKGKVPGANPFMEAIKIARGIRAHVRVLCRAVAGWEEVLPTDLIDALVRAVRNGALAQPQKGRVDAFSAKYEGGSMGQRRGRPIAADLGEALNALAGDERDRVLRAILEIDEPALFAQLVAWVPNAIRDSIFARIDDLTPADAGELWSLTDLQTRIEELLEAGAHDAAKRFMDVEREVKTWGEVPGRELARLTADLRLRLLRKDYDGISRLEPPQELSQGQLAEARDTIAFYQALAQQARPDGDLVAAEQTFEQLQRRRSDIVAYTVNLLSVRASRLLAGDLFGTLHGENAKSARKALADADASMGEWLAAT